MPYSLRKRIYSRIESSNRACVCVYVCVLNVCMFSCLYVFLCLYTKGRERGLCGFSFNFIKSHEEAFASICRIKSSVCSICSLGIVTMLRTHWSTTLDRSRLKAYDPEDELRSSMVTEKSISVEVFFICATLRHVDIDTPAHLGRGTVRVCLLHGRAYGLYGHKLRPAHDVLGNDYSGIWFERSEPLFVRENQMGSWMHMMHSRVRGSVFSIHTLSSKQRMVRDIWCGLKNSSLMVCMYEVILGTQLSSS